jgi:nicotinamidase/pyrazinamidase
VTTTRQGDLRPRAGDALVVVDLQRDFLPGGALGVARGDRVLAAINDYLERFAAEGLPAFATRDWHPADHCSFVGQGGPWPVHCVAGSAGAAFADGLRLPADATVVSKATTPDRDAYSGFEGTDLQARLRRAQVVRLFVGGLATDYCVLQTVKDALALGFRVVLLTDAIAAVDARAGDGQRAVDAMRAAGATLADRGDLMP